TTRCCSQPPRSWLPASGQCTPPRRTPTSLLTPTLGSSTRLARPRSPRSSAKSSPEPMRWQRAEYADPHRYRRKTDMTATTTDETSGPSQQTPGVGRIARVTGPTIDVEFAPGEIPGMYNALVAEIDKSTIGQGEGTLEMIFEVAQFLGDNLVRAIALKPSDGLVRGMAVRDTGEPISVPVGDVTKGHVFSATGDALDLPEGEQLEVTERWPIHRKPPAFDQLESKTQMFETGIKVIDLLTPYVLGGKIGLFGGAGVGKTVLIQEMIQ